MIPGTLPFPGNLCSYTSMPAALPSLWVSIAWSIRKILTTLRREQAEIENAIAAYEKRAEESRRDLSAINAVIRLFSVETDAGSVTGYMDSRRRSRTYRLVRSHFRAGEIGKERRHVSMLPLDDAGEFRAKLKRQPEAADPHILDAVA